MMRSLLVCRLVVLCGLAWCATLAAAQQSPDPAATPPTPTGPQASTADAGRAVSAELIIEDQAGRPLTNVKPTEVAVLQDGAVETVDAFTYDAKAGLYELRYRPHDGRLGPVAIRVNRAGAQVRGAYGDVVSLQWVKPEQPFEAPLLAALEDAASAPAPANLDFEVRPLRFGEEQRGWHYILALELPAGFSGGQPSHRLAFLTRVLRQNGREACRASTEQAVTTARGQFVSWAGHCHLHPGDYVLEAAVQDEDSARIGVKREPLRVVPGSPFHASSLIVLSGAGKALPSETDDNPLRVADVTLIPALRPQFVTGSEAKLPFIFTLYPDPKSTAAVEAHAEITQNGVAIARGKIALQPPENGEIGTFALFPVSDRVPGAYAIRLVAHQGDAEAVMSAPFSMIAPIRVGESASSEEPVPVGGSIREPRKTKAGPPIYPQDARQRGIQGSVALACVIGPNGKVVSATPVSGPKELMSAAVDAVRKWEYAPTLIDGRPVPVRMTVTINFRIR